MISPTKEPAEKSGFLSRRSLDEGDGLQPVHKPLQMRAALAAEGDTWDATPK
jgi:hypothetical protein